MDYELYKKIKKSSSDAFDKLCDLYLKKAWFICRNILTESNTAAPLLVESWNKALKEISEMSAPPKESFMTLVSKNILKNYKNIKADEMFSDVPRPVIDFKYEVLTDSVKSLSIEKRALFLTSSFGELNTALISEILGVSFEEASALVNEASSEYIDKAKKSKKMSGAELVKLSTKFTSSDGKSTDCISIPQEILSAIGHTHNKVNKENNKINTTSSKPVSSKKKDTVRTVRKDTIKMNEDKMKKRRAAKIRKAVITAVIVLIIIVLIIIFLPKILKNLKTTEAATTTTTYKVEEITYGDVDTTISGSGTLSAIKSETLTAPYTEAETAAASESEDNIFGSNNNSNTNSSTNETYTVATLNYAAGEEFSDGDVIAILTDSDGASTKLTAEYDGIVLECELSEGDEITSGTEVATIMSKDGFELTLSVDETDIASVAKDQEVSVTVDAVSETYTGKVSSISYNGTSSGSSSSYEIKATIDYTEGLYPAMSASAEIVTESSGEGLLVPVDAVKTSGDDSYVYLAPSGAESGTEYSESEISLDDLEKVTVETGSTDGSYILIESDSISEGDLIIVTSVTSSLTGSDSSDSDSGFGGFGGGNMPQGGGDMGDFDPSNMPQGGGGGGNFGGGQQS